MSAFDFLVLAVHCMKGKMIVYQMKSRRKFFMRSVKRRENAVESIVGVDTTALLIFRHCLNVKLSKDNQ